MTRALYSLLMWLIQPLLRRKLARRGVQEPGYLQAVEERFGHYSVPPSAGWLWVHAVSLGETRAAAILLAALRKQNPALKLLLTHGTATGREEGVKLLQPGDTQVWQPWDTPGAVGRFLAHFQPALGVLVETEVWPNMAALCKKRGVPLVLVNARLSEKTWQQAQRLAWLARPAYGALAAVYAQTEADAKRLHTLGAQVQGVFGNLKFDAKPDAAQVAQGQRWRSELQKPVVVFASSREGEEALFLQNLKLFMPRSGVDIEDSAIKIEAIGGPEKIQWLVVPRHPQRFDAVAALVQAQGFSVSRRSTWNGTPEPADVWLGDSLGEMALYYGMA
ncbi:MAG: glycosyltransferase N-terminal domain-containing protein, partial [Pseudomonadota bacterium]